MEQINPQHVSETNQEYDRAKALKDFDDAKVGVKGVVDAGITTLPQIFVMPPDDQDITTPCDNGNKKLPNTSEFPQFKVPLVDLKDIDDDSPRRKQIVKEIRHACETWGFFQVLHHGIPQHTMDNMIERVRRFNEQPNEVRREFYSRDKIKKVRFNSNFDLYKAKAANWRDT
ncbi:hypothetical protein L484_024531 [Morus notabilis]|uniref:Non-haem dioxygenase N-terminal domain-containing protein n=1 Tax=Morus notabilis TaxID=981085 RepID=W9S6T0_9ROSA|nr:hypothetical protein L484_024531 [Morus notabilis]